jgi:hypothetical protein
MKKSIKIVLPIVTLLGALIVCFCLYIVIIIRKANTTPILNNSNWVIKVDGIELGKVLYKELLWEDSHRTLIDSTQFREVKGLTIPLNMYVFNTTKSPNTFYTSALLNDEKILLTNFKHENNWIRVDTQDFEHLYKYQNLNLYVTFNKKRVFFIWNYQSNQCKEDLKHLLNNEECTKYNKSKYAAILNKNHILTATNLSDNIWVKFNDGKIDIQGNLNWARSKNRTLHIKNGIQNAIFNTCVHTHTALDINSIMEIFPTYDSLVKSLLIPHKDINFNLAISKNKIINYKDTSSFFDFDDYGSKVLKTTTEENTMPLLVFVMNYNNTWKDYVNPYNYKVKESIFNQFPLYLHPINNYLLGTNAYNIPKVQTENVHNCAFKLYLELDKKEISTTFDKEMELSKIFQIINIQGAYSNATDIQVNGTIEMKDKTTNALKTIYNFIKTKG